MVSWSSHIVNRWRDGRRRRQCRERPNGEAQPPADGDSVLKWYGARHETDLQNDSDSAGRLERNVRLLDTTRLRIC